MMTLVVVTVYVAVLMAGVPSAAQAVDQTDALATLQNGVVMQCKKTHTGGCTNHRQISISLKRNVDSVSRCLEECTQDKRCEGFSFGKTNTPVDRTCILYREGCQKDSTNQRWDFYSKKDCITSGTSECKWSEDCPTSKPYCRQSLCYECIGDGHCSYPKSHCFANNCTECVDDSHCPSSLSFCDIGDNTCKVVNTCQTDSQCPELLPICDAGDRQCKECTTDSHCSSLMWCRGNACREKIYCFTDDECTADGYCDRDHHACVKWDWVMSGYDYHDKTVCGGKYISKYATLHEARTNCQGSCGCIRLVNCEGGPYATFVGKSSTPTNGRLTHMTSDYTRYKEIVDDCGAWVKT